MSIFARCDRDGPSTKYLLQKPGLAGGANVENIRLALSGRNVRAEAELQSRGPVCPLEKERWVDPIENPTVRGYQFGRYDPVSNTFGEAVRVQGTVPHQGLDLLAPVGTQVRAVQSGFIVAVHFWNPRKKKDKGEKFGTYVMLQFKYGPGFLYAFYAHLSKVYYGLNGRKEHVYAGWVLGLTGETGNAESVPEDEKHLHFGISTVPRVTPMSEGKWLDPQGFMKIHWQDKPYPFRA